MRSFGEVLRSEREKKGLSQEELGNLIRAVKSTISQYELGKRKPDTEILQQFADIFKCSVDYLLGRTTNPTPPAADITDEFRPTPEDELLIFYKARDLSEESQKLIKEQIEHLHRLERERWERQKTDPEKK